MKSLLGTLDYNAVCRPLQIRSDPWMSRLTMVIRLSMEKDAARTQSPGVTSSKRGTTAPVWFMSTAGLQVSPFSNCIHSTRELQSGVISFHTLD